jgi:hypothetical protein
MVVMAICSGPGLRATASIDVASAGARKAIFAFLSLYSAAKGDMAFGH